VHLPGTRGGGGGGHNDVARVQRRRRGVRTIRRVGYSARRKRAKSAAGERVGVAFRSCAGGAATTRTQYGAYGPTALCGACRVFTEYRRPSVGGGKAARRF